MEMDNSVSKQAVAVEDVPQPDWSQAPDGANWWTVDADGLVCWWIDEPDRGNHFEWYVYDEDPMEGTVHIDIPIGIDWRELKAQRPQVQA